MVEREFPMARMAPWIRCIALAILMAVYVYGVSWSASIQDTVRDLFQAWDIRHGMALPLEGPVLGIPHAIHFGPIWFYLLALPLFVWDTWTAAILFAGLLCSLKFPLAFYCGRRLLNSDFGMLWAAALALPNWSLLEQLVVFNPNAAPMAILLALAVFLRMRSGEMPAVWGASLGVAMGFALHVHPTTAPVLALAPLFVMHLHRRGQPIIRALCAMLAGLAFLFLPYVASQVMNGFPDFVSANAYMERQVSASNLKAWPSLLASLFFVGPRTMGAAVMGMSEGMAFALGASVTLVSLGALASIRTDRRVALSAFCALLVFSVAIAALRPNTPFYFFYALGPFVAAIVALSLWRLSTGSRGVSVAVFVVVATALHVGATWALARMVRSGNGVLPISVLDIKASAGAAVFTDVWYPTWHRPRLAKLLCSKAVATLHGHLAYIEDRSVGLDRLFGCGDPANLRLGGTSGADHLLAMSRSFWGALNASPRCWAGSLGVAAQARAIAPLEGLDITDGRVYFPRPVSQAPAKPARVSFKAAPGEAVLVTNVLAGYERLTNVHVRAAGSSLRPIASNEVSTLYVGPDPAHEADWLIEFEASEPRSIDIAIFKPAPGQEPVGSCTD